MEIKEKFIGLILFFTASLFVPAISLATGVGFVPAGGIWFSNTVFSAQETIRIYTVVINNKYYALDARVEFFDNGKLVGGADIKGLRQETAQTVKVLWLPKEGAHTVSARLTQAVAVDAAGKRSEIPSIEINSLAGVTLAASESQTSVGPAVQDEALGSATVVVRREGDRFLITAPEPAQVQGDKIAATSTEEIDSQQNKDENDPFKKNREALEKIQKAAATVTSTAGTLSQAYNETKTLLEKGKNYYAVGRDWLVKFRPVSDKIKAGWLIISDNNNPKRVALIGGGVVVVWFLWRRSRRIDRRYYGH